MNKSCPVGMYSPSFSGWLCSKAEWTTRPHCKMVWNSRPHLWIVWPTQFHLWPGSQSQVIYFVEDNMSTWHFFSYLIPLPNVHYIKLKNQFWIIFVEEMIKHGIKPTDIIQICTSIRSLKYAISFFNTVGIICFKEKASTYIFYMLMVNFTPLSLILIRNYFCSCFR